jgi:Zn-dependent protease with chaperone function
MSKNKEWDYHPLNERVAEAGISLATAGAYGLALSQIFNPIALGVAAAYGVAQTGYLYYKLHKEDAIDEAKKKGYFEELADDNQHLQPLVDEFTEAAGMTPHKVVRATEKFIKQAMLPWHLRWIMKVPKIKEKIMNNAAAANTTMDLMMVTRPFTKSHDPDVIRFVTAHEISHAKVEDSYKLNNIAKVTKKHMNRVLLIGAVATAAAGLVGFAAVPAVFAGGLGLFKGALLLGVASSAANIGLNYANRIKERRADRNAIYLTRDIQPAIKFLNSVEDNKVPPKKPAFMELSSHPSYHPRIANLKAAFAEVSQYPTPRTAKKDPVTLDKLNETPEDIHDMDKWDKLITKRSQGLHSQFC